MFSLQKLFGRQERFFALLEQAALHAHDSAIALRALISESDCTQGLDAVVAARKKEKAVNRDISVLLCTAFITPFEREDIEALSTALYRVPKTLEKFASRLSMAPELLDFADFAVQAEMIMESTSHVLEMVRMLENTRNIERVVELNDHLQNLENQADMEVLQLQKKLYADASGLSVMKILWLNDLYKMLERVMDRCRDAGKAVYEIFLKYS